MRQVRNGGTNSPPLDHFTHMRSPRSSHGSRWPPGTPWMQDLTDVRSMALTVTSSTNSSRTGPTTERTTTERCRLLLEIAQGVATEIGSQGTAVRISPFTILNSGTDANPEALLVHLLRELENLNLGAPISTLHLISSDVTQKHI